MRYTFLLLICLLILSGLSLAQPSWALTAGDLVKVAGQEAVYYIGENGQRFVYPQRNVFLSWYQDFSQVKTVSLDEVAKYPLGGNITMRPGVNLIKIQSDPKVYAVSPGGILHHIDSEVRAITLYGENWADRVVDVSDAFFGDYQIGSPINKNQHPDGTLIKYAVLDNIYLVQNGKKRCFKDLAALTANGYSENDVIPTTINYSDATRIDGLEKTLAAPAKTIAVKEKKEKPKTEVQQMFISSDYSQIAANGKAKTIIRATLKDADGQIMTDYSEPVTFMTNLGVLSSISAKPNAGIAQTILTAGYRTGTAEVTASINNITKSINIDIVPVDLLQPHATMFKDPSLLTPAINSVGSGEEYVLTWGAIANVDYYIVQEDTDKNFGAPEEFQVTDNNITLSHELLNTTTYYYRVKGVYNTVEGFWNNTVNNKVVDMVIVGSGV